MFLFLSPPCSLKSRNVSSSEDLKKEETPGSFSNSLQHESTHVVEGDYPLAKRRVLTSTQPCWHPHLGLSASTCEK